MKRLALVALLIAFAATAGQAHASGGVGIQRPATSPDFPVKSSGPDAAPAQSLKASEIAVTENGRPVTGVHVVPASGRGAARFWLSWRSTRA